MEKLLGRPKFRVQGISESNQVGLTTGLAWTEVGGEVLQTEATLMDGKGLLFAGHSESFLHASDLFRSQGKTVYELANGAR